MIKERGMVFSHGHKVKFIKEDSRIMRDMELGYFNFLMEVKSLVSGIMGQGLRG